ncbi:HTH-type transcriptional regulator CysL [BD1-7 clade bacterium]|uniref:HTH-type transcriptional regulator CysL n=1 Tax=BD1-7 clade bacterium TaxID=2029982 RepID=A0A5S9PKP1_9GAMM|nr:HTH-type transcriptional regulator CysL [BD1-7 clade bacterium]
MNLIQLRLFRDIARELSFAKAARQNNITQPAVSIHIKKLEDELGKKLFNRTPHNIQLTPEGMIILADVKKILQLSEGLKIRSSYSQGVLEGNIRIATIHSIGMYEMGEFLSSFMKSFPKVHIHMEFRRFDDIYSLLLKEKIDLGVVAYPEQRTNIEAIPYSEDELVLIVAKDHRFSNKKTILLEHIESEPFIAFESGMPTREATDKVLDEKGIRVDIRMTNDNIYTLKKIVEAGIGVSIVPSNTVDEEVQRGSLVRIRIRDTKLTRPLALLKLKKTVPNTPLEIFMERMLSHGGNNT